MSSNGSLECLREPAAREPSRDRRTLLRLVTLVLVLAVVAPALLKAQVDPGVLASQNLRGYSHVFIAYTVAWLIVLGWLFSVARRLGRVERSLER